MDFPRPKSTSLPPLPRRLSSPLAPLKVSGPLVPTLLTAQATPLASSRANAIAASTSTTRRMPSPLLSRAPDWSVRIYGNKTARLALLPRISLLGTWVNKGKNKGRSPLEDPGPVRVAGFAYATRVVGLLCWRKSDRKP